MSDGGGLTFPGAGAALRAVVPPDDAGAETLDRYEWQAMMATADLLALYYDVLAAGLDPSIAIDCGLVCEYHEDWSWIRSTEIQLVSGKHKEPRFGAFTTTASLLDDGGLFHLFDRWHTLGQSATCRLVTTAGLDRDAAVVSDLCQHYRAADTTEDLDEYQTALHARLAAGIAERRAANGQNLLPDLISVELPAFLAVLQIETGVPRRVHLPTYAPGAYAAPVARALGRADLAEPLWEAVLSLVRGRMRAAGGLPRSLLPNLGLGDTDPLARRTVTVADANVAAMAALMTPDGFKQLPMLKVTNKLAVKMATGDCAATSIERAETLRRMYASWRREQRSRPGGREVEVRLNLLLMRVADEATSSVRGQSTPWGTSLWQELALRLEHESGSGAAVALDTDLLLGGIADLANSCKVWFSEPFDAQAVLDAARQEAS